MCGGVFFCVCVCVFFFFVCLFLLVLPFLFSLSLCVVVVWWVGVVQKATGPCGLQRAARLAAPSRRRQSLHAQSIKTNASAIGATADSSHFDATVARTDSLLQNETASLSVVSASISQDVLSVALSVQNEAGHKFPSGIPARRAWLHVTIKDARSRVVFESGRPQANGSIEGNNADLNPAQYEPHYDIITLPTQVQIYEPIMLDSDDAVTYTLLRAAAYAKDNRLLPFGFDKATAAADIAVWGSAEADANFIGGEDRITYSANVSGKRRPLTVTAKLLYQPVSYPFAENLRQDGTEQVARFFGFYDAADKTPRVISQVQASVR